VVFHPITWKGDYQRFTHGIGAGDVNGDAASTSSSPTVVEQPENVEPGKP